MNQFDEAQAEAFLEAAEEDLTPTLRGEAMTIADQLRQEGMKKGMQQGMQRGAQQAAQQFASKLLAEGTPSEKVAQLTDLPMEVVRQLAEQETVN